jgi:hypothetical protein
MLVTMDWLVRESDIEYVHVGLVLDCSLLGRDSGRRGYGAIARRDMAALQLQRHCTSEISR